MKPYQIQIQQEENGHIACFMTRILGNGEGGSYGQDTIEDLERIIKLRLKFWIETDNCVAFKELSESTLDFSSNHPHFTKDWVLRTWKMLRVTHNPPKYYYDDNFTRHENKVESNGLGRWFK